ncbi:hypothetical protein D1AOALGA4SA_961 [Olavius algarvensis Delta 1 endosymbiont]|nr:hypothetical protein D1AOALGA4SA_961 [Olavius algarvensis Delta 1 endosymbiont]
MVECWVYWTGIYFYMDGTDQFVKSDCHPLCEPNIPLFHWNFKINSTPLG